MPSEITFGKTIPSTSPYIENGLEVKPIASIPTDTAFQADLDSNDVADDRGGIPFSNKGLTGNVYIDGILWGGNYWSSGSSSTTTIDYSFWNSGTASFDDAYYDIAQNPYDWLAGEMASMVNALDTWSAVANIQFLNAGDNNESATLGFYKVGEADIGNDFLGLFIPPGIDGQGIGYFNSERGDWNTYGIPKGDLNFTVLIHELGHGLGLAHPHDDGGGSSIYPGVTSAEDTGDYGLNQGVYTTMSYNRGLAASGGDPGTSDYGNQATPMAFDVAAIQYLYGANYSYKTGNDTYFLPTANQSGTYYSCIWDAGGIDTISGVGALSGVTINLNDASLNAAVDGAGAGGYLSSAQDILGGFTIANGAIIENADGSAFADLITGNEFNNTLNGGAGNDTLIGGSGNDTLIGGAGNDSLSGGNGNDSLDGGLGADTLKGGYGNDTINGGAGNDTVDGGVGGDLMTGGTGNDTYFVNSSSDRIREYSNEGIDTVVSSLSYTLGNNLENLVLGNDALNGTGNSLNNIISGNAANNELYGGFGSDAVYGEDGDDYIFGGTATSYDTSNDYLNGGSGNDTLLGGTGNDTLLGGDGDDILSGYAGIDTLVGGTGNDTYYVDNTSNTIIENLDEGIDTVITSVNYALDDNLENLYLIDSAVVGTGNSLNNTVVGNAGNNSVYGGFGSDAVYGGFGSDAVYGEDGDDFVNGGTATSYDTSNDYLDGGSGNDTLLGGFGSDTLAGGDGNDILNGYTSGYDILTGGSGSDTFVLGNSSDIFYQGNGYAIITDWNASSDVIRLAGSSSDYSLEAVNYGVGGSASDTGIYFNNGTSNDLIAILQDSTSFSGLNFSYV
jgi:Ca2+-binding RTX toxin-like protein